ncbi:MAG TPA: hypothetical protein VJ654_10890 [Noviherbaspirillum sp.]|nr:hypothetical protein [Noviherbaspirillum sp.]
MFTIAMYGETNAGKSTIIETLRILFNEPRKCASQAQFRQIAQSIQFDTTHIESLQLQIQQASVQKLTQEQELLAMHQQHASAQARSQQTVQQLQDAIQDKKSKFGLWQKIVHLFKKLEEERLLAAQINHLHQLKSAHQSAEHKLQTQIDALGAQVQLHQQELSHIHRNLERLAPFEDGAIIGNGRSDFTIESQSYQFDVQGQKFALIDVPGIEGNEKSVSDAINGAVKKSHAVLYITRKPSPPNKGEPGQPGTIEKIRAHLGTHTEVWAVYNKGVTNPMALQAPKLINEGEATSLQDLDKELKSQLGDSYQGCLNLSALPAFYSATDCLLPTNSHYKNRQKFLAGMAIHDLLEKSNFASFMHFVSKELCSNYKDKIRKSNMRKIQSSIQEGLRTLHELIETFSTAKNNLDSQLKSASRELDQLQDSIARRVKSRCRDKISQTKVENRKKIRSRIEKDLSNDEFKQIVERRIANLKEDLVEALQATLRAEIDGFEIEIKEVVTRFLKNVDEVLEININRHFGAGPGHFDLEFKIDNGINTVGLLSSLGGAAALVWGTFFASNPLGWSIAAAIGAVTLLFSFYKAVRSFFSSSYKMEQQRKVADENLAMVFDKIEQMLDERMSEAGNEIAQTMERLKDQLSVPLNSVQTTLQTLRAASKEINKIATTIV